MTERFLAGSNVDLEACSYSSIQRAISSRSNIIAPPMEYLTIYPEAADQSTNTGLGCLEEAVQQ